LHQVGDLFELNVKLRCQNVNCRRFRALEISGFWCSVVKHFDLQHLAVCSMPQEQRPRFSKLLLEFTVKVLKSLSNLDRNKCSFRHDFKLY
jgi:hypothetical protein